MEEAAPRSLQGRAAVRVSPEHAWTRHEGPGTGLGAIMTLHASTPSAVSRVHPTCRTRGIHSSGPPDSLERNLRCGERVRVSRDRASPSLTVWHLERASQGQARATAQYRANENPHGLRAYETDSMGAREGRRHTPGSTRLDAQG